MDKIVGVRFTGPQESYTDDKYFKTGARWLIGTVHNFSQRLARKFFSYPCFEQAEINPDGDTFVSSAGTKPQEVAANINLQAMDADRLVHMARYEYNRVVDPVGKSVDQLRAEVRTLTVLHSLDLAEDDRNSNVIRKLSPDEFSALMGIEPLLDTTVEPVSKPTQPEPDETPKDEPKAIPISLDAMSKDELAVFALENYGQKIDKRGSVEAMRAKVSALMVKEDSPEPDETP